MLKFFFGFDRMHENNFFKIEIDLKDFFEIFLILIFLKYFEENQVF